MTRAGLCVGRAHDSVIKDTFILLSRSLSAPLSGTDKDTEPGSDSDLVWARAHDSCRAPVRPPARPPRISGRRAPSSFPSLKRRRARGAPSLGAALTPPPPARRWATRPAADSPGAGVPTRAPASIFLADAPPTSAGTVAAQAGPAQARHCLFPVPNSGPTVLPRLR